MKLSNLIRQVYAIQAVSDRIRHGRIPSEELMEIAGLGGVDISNFQHLDRTSNDVGNGSRTTTVSQKSGERQPVSLGHSSMPPLPA